MEFGIEFSGIQVQWMENEYFVGNLRAGNVKEIKLTYHKPREWLTVIMRRIRMIGAMCWEQSSPLKEKSPSDVEDTS
jgi:hypothetical protein